MLFSTIVSLVALSGAGALAAPPVAVTNGDTTMIGPAEVPLNGSKSYDPDGGVLTYKWEQLNGPKVVVKDADKPIAAVSMPLHCRPKVYNFRLTVTDQEGLSSSSDMKVTMVKEIVLPNNPPVAKLPMDIKVEGKMSVALDGSESYDPDGDVLTYMWTQEYGPTIAIVNSDKAIARIDFPDTTLKQTYTFKLTVQDPRGMKASSTMRCFHEPKDVKPNLPPQVLVAEEVFTNANEKFRIYADCWDPEEQPMTRDWDVPPSFEIAKITEAYIHLKAPNVTNDTTFPIVLTVSDGELNTTKKISVHVKGALSVIAEEEKQKKKLMGN